VRDFILSRLPSVEFLVLNDVANAAVERKVAQVVAAAEAAGQVPNVAFFHFCFKTEIRAHLFTVTCRIPVQV
jgi:hypothetical protein